MRALALEGPGRARVVEVAEVPIPPGRVAVEIDWCGLHPEDYGSFRRGRPEPGGFGSCWSGRIAELGVGVVGLFVGERVVGPAAGVSGLAERVVVEPAVLCPVPEGVDDRDAVLVGPASLAVHAVLRAEVRVGDLVLVVGAGLSGLLTVAVARLAGAGMVSVIEDDPTRWEAACDVGADSTFVDADEARRTMGGRGVGGGADVTFEVTGSARALRMASELTRVGGSIVIGPGSADVDGALRLLVTRELALLGCRAATADDLRRVFDLVANDRLKLAGLRRPDAVSLADVPDLLADGDPSVPLAVVSLHL